MLVELSVVEQRYLAVREALDSGATITDIARRYGVDRRTVHRWLVRYAAGGLSALADRSSKPDRCPHQISPELEARIVALRRANPGWGPRTNLTRLRRELGSTPSRSAIYRCLVRHRLIAPKPRRRRRGDYKRWERSRAMELWQIDVMGGVRLTDGTQLSVVTGIDDHSRFCVIAKLVPRATARPVCDALMEGLSRHGVPEQILTDNGKVFTRKLGRKPANVLFDRICLNNGIRHLLTAPYSPTTTGKIERLHKTMRKEFFASDTFASIDQAQQALDRWVEQYNHHREHQAIGDVPPIRRFELAVKKAFDVVDGEVETEQVPQDRPRVVARRVDQAGQGWTELPIPPEIRTGAAQVWTGSQLLIWGGYTGFDERNVVANGLAFDAAEMTWREPLGTEWESIQDSWRRPQRGHARACTPWRMQGLLGALAGGSVCGSPGLPPQGLGTDPAGDES